MPKLKLSLMTAAGPVNILQPVACLILDNKEDEFLLGNDVLKALGINVECQLELLAAPTCDDGDDDEALPEVVAGDNDAEAARKAVEALVQRALDEGFPADKVERLRTIVYAYAVWKLVLCNDPPTNVKPMRVRMKTGCRPMNRDIVQVFRAMCLEAKVDIRDWVHFIPAVQSNLNHTPVPSLANKAPVELFCAQPAASPLYFGFNGEDNTFLELGTTSS
ncbi:unnamed protein product [Phytophthora fragariaefolia]|uniref:Unnamed protein product n=1 Tax=Phytophthora fragariaefolia TaxID=1490495 RepID=A0A9W7DD48_9STRA|nr:unnamed protein product [Phytophthora fragariaefolia]